MSDHDEIGEYAFVVGADEPMAYNPGDVMSEHVGHEDIGVLAVGHIHRTGHDIHHVEV